MGSELTNEQITAARRLADAATPGPWYAVNPDDEYCMNALLVVTGGPDIGDVNSQEWSEDSQRVVAGTLIQRPATFGHAAEKWDEDTAFIAAARQLVPDLISTLAARDRRIAELEGAELTVFAAFRNGRMYGLFESKADAVAFLTPGSTGSQLNEVKAWSVVRKSAANKNAPDASRPSGAEAHG